MRQRKAKNFYIKPTDYDGVFCNTNPRYNYSPKGGQSIAKRIVSDFKRKQCPFFYKIILAARTKQLRANGFESAREAALARDKKIIELNLNLQQFPLQILVPKNGNKKSQ